MPNLNNSQHLCECAVLNISIRAHFCVFHLSSYETFFMLAMCVYMFSDKRHRRLILVHIVHINNFEEYRKTILS